jgi:hypothetical protein
VEILKWLFEAVRGRRPELWPNDWILHHDSAPAHKALSVKDFLAKNLLLEESTHPFPLLWLRIPKIKSALKERRFQDIKNIRKM